MPTPAEIARQSLIFVATTYYPYIGISISNSRNQDTSHDPRFLGNHSAEKEVTPAIRANYHEFRRSLENSPGLESPDFRSKARKYLTRLPSVQFLELVTDVRDELVIRRGCRNESVPIPISLLARNHYHTERNEARKKIADLDQDVLKILMVEVYHELGRRHPALKKTNNVPKPPAANLPGLSRPKVEAAHVRPPLHPKSANLNLPRNLTEPLSDSSSCGVGGHPADVISRTTPITNVVSILGHHGCPDVTDRLDTNKCTSNPVSGGGFADVYRGHFRNGSQVAIKCPRKFGEQNELGRVDLKEAARELHTWLQYNHPNVVPLLGLARFQGRIAMVSPWMANGTLVQYLARTPDADRCRLCSEITSGVAYMHGVESVHGDIKATNVLISGTGSAMLTDFGNSRLQNSTLGFTGSETSTKLSTRWTAPELLSGGGYTKEADIYALGMTILEVISGCVPFKETKNDSAVIKLVTVDKQTPSRPQPYIPSESRQGNKLWELLSSCWSFDPRARPAALYVDRQMAKITSNGLRTTSSSELGRVLSEMSQ